jgi:3-deoxy-D-manno-octulosonic-acid transferase
MTWHQRLARGGYSTLLRMLRPVYLLRLYWRGRSEPLYRHAIAERLGSYRGAPSEGWLWIHAVSLGETRAASALIDALRAGTAGAAPAAHARHGDRARGRQGPAAARATTGLAAVRHAGGGDPLLPPFRPQVGVLMETEVWPNLLHAAERHGVTMVLANARLSEKSRRQGQRLRAVIGPAVEHLAWCSRRPRPTRRACARPARGTSS